MASPILVTSAAGRVGAVGRTITQLDATTACRRRVYYNRAALMSCRSSSDKCGHILLYLGESGLRSVDARFSLNPIVDPG